MASRFARLLGGPGALLAGHARCDVFAFGDNTAGQCGTGGASAQRSPAKVPMELRAGEKVVGVSGGLQFSACVTSEGRVFTWGNTKDNRLGHSLSVSSVTNAVQVPGMSSERATAVSCGDAHVMVLTAAGQLYAWGRSPHGETGRGSEDRTVDFNAGTRPKVGAGVPLGPVSTPEKVTQVACGRHHTLALMEGGGVYGWGESRESQIVPSKEDQRSPTLIPGTPPGVVSVGCGGGFSAVVTASGEVWTWGSNIFGQLGHGVQVAVPTRVEGLAGEQVTQLACGTAHCVALTKSGRVFTWGYGRDGQLGHADKNTAMVPQVVGGLGGVQIVRVAAGDGHTLAVAKDGRVFMFGRGRDGQLGLDGLVSVKDSCPTPSDCAFFARSKLNVADAALGKSHSLVVTNP